MVAIVLGMIMVAALATLIANQSTNRSEIDRAGKMIENGRYAVQAIAQDVELAGYWGEISTTPAVPATLPDPCSTAIADLSAAMGQHVQGYDAPATLPVNLAVCVKNAKPGSDVLVVRRVEPDTSDVEKSSGCPGSVTPPCVDWTKVKEGQVYLQTGLVAATNAFSSILRTADGTNDSTNFTLTKRDLVKISSPRKYVVHIYYIAKCSVEVSGGCTGADGGNPIPTLKRVELGRSGGAPAFSTITIAEGIENMQIDYGNDTDGDGVADGADQDGSTCNTIASNPACAGAEYTPVDWGNVMSVKVHLLARSTETTPGYTDTKTYTLGSVNVAAPNDGYRRHVFDQSVRIVNPASRRSN